MLTEFRLKQRKQRTKAPPYPNTKTARHPIFLMLIGCLQVRGRLAHGLTHAESRPWTALTAPCPAHPASLGDWSEVICKAKYC